MKVGDRVILKNNSYMNAPIGSTAIVTREPYDFNLTVFPSIKQTKLIDVKWEGNIAQGNGGYRADKFELLISVYEQKVAQQAAQQTTKIDYMAITREICGGR